MGRDVETGTRLEGGREVKLQSAGSGARHRTTEGAEAATRPQTRRGRVTGTIVAVVSFVAIGGVLLFLFSLAEGALDWIADDAPPSAQLAFSVSLLAVGIGWATRTSRRLRGAARYPGIIHRCDSRGEGGWTGVLAVTLPE
jgi:hypothetical protein